MVHPFSLFPYLYDLCPPSYKTCILLSHSISMDWGEFPYKLSFAALEENALEENVFYCFYSFSTLLALWISFLYFPEDVLLCWQCVVYASPYENLQFVLHIKVLEGLQKIAVGLINTWSRSLLTLLSCSLCLLHHFLVACFH